jgi:hypothetical protein
LRGTIDAAFAHDGSSVLGIGPCTDETMSL